MFRQTLLNKSARGMQGLKARKRRTGVGGVGQQQEQEQEQEQEHEKEEKEEEKDDGDFDEPNLGLQGSISTLGNPSEIDDGSVEGGGEAPIVELPSAMNMAQNIESYVSSSRPSSSKPNKEEEKKGEEKEGEGKGLGSVLPRRGSVLGSPKHGPDLLTDEECPPPEKW